ncbi:ATP-binding protein [Streptomyces sp. H27-D2]|uniref:ATP-binding protein n=1 Tax=Streptomyces sp. H27-D2 TaxID=3046304 RepID=UPI002DBD5D9B|nr:ATP-binding protein [Streptomyces sp. H27-D2]MEC4015478.1 ATP-binding protein [Streptomyces sp. H27-D2]
MSLTLPSASAYPPQASAAFDGENGMAALAREFAAAFLARVQKVHGVPVTARLIGAVCLVVSELITNAVKYAPGPCLLDLALADGELHVTVGDTEAGLPVTLTPDAGRIGGHGLEIVLGLSRGYEVERQPGGKRVRAHIPLD